MSGKDEWSNIPTEDTYSTGQIKLKALKGSNLLKYPIYLDPACIVIKPDQIIEPHIMYDMVSVTCTTLFLFYSSYHELRIMLTSIIELIAVVRLYHNIKINYVVLLIVTFL